MLPSSALFMFASFAFSGIMKVSKEEISVENTSHIHNTTLSSYSTILPDKLVFVPGKAFEQSVILHHM